MLASFLSRFTALTHGTSFLTALMEFAAEFDKDYLKDKDLKNALIDEAIAYLNQMKNVQ